MVKSFVAVSISLAFTAWSGVSFDSEFSSRATAPLVTAAAMLRTAETEVGGLRGEGSFAAVGQRIDDVDGISLREVAIRQIGFNQVSWRHQVWFHDVINRRGSAGAVGGDLVIRSVRSFRPVLMAPTVITKGWLAGAWMVPYPEARSRADGLRYRRPLPRRSQLSTPSPRPGKEDRLQTRCKCASPRTG